MRTKKISLPFGGLKALWMASFASPKTKDGLQEFNQVANIAARGCLLVGAITSMGFIYLTSYGIFKALLPYWAANILSFVAIGFWFMIVDRLLEVTFPLWCKYLVEGKFAFERGHKGSGLMLTSGIFLFLIILSVVGISVWTSFESAEIPVMQAMTSISSTDSTSSSQLKEALKGQLNLQKMMESFDKQLAEAKRIDDEEIRARKLAGHKRVNRTRQNLAGYMKSNNRDTKQWVANQIRKAEKDSASRVEDYQRQYLRVMRDKEDAMSKLQASNTRMEMASMKKEERMQRMFDRKAEISIALLTIFGVMGTLLFIGIKFVQIVLNAGVEATKATKVEKQIDMWHGANHYKSSTGTSGGGENQGGRGSKKTNWNSNKFHQNFDEVSDGHTELSGTFQDEVPGPNDEIHVAFAGKKMLRKDVRKAVMKHANNYNAIKHNIRQGNAHAEYMRWLGHVEAIALVDPALARKLMVKCEHEYDIKIGCE